MFFSGLQTQIRSSDGKILKVNTHFAIKMRWTAPIPPFLDEKSVLRDNDIYTHFWQASLLSLTARGFLEDAERERKGQLELYTVMYVILVPELRMTR